MKNANIVPKAINRKSCSKAEIIALFSIAIGYALVAFAKKA